MSTPTSHISAVPAAPSFAEALRYWLKLGCISFGGPAGQIALMHAELVERRRWMSERRFLHALNYCMVLPGPEATQLAICIGWLLHRTRGGIAAGVLFVLPSLLVLIALSWLYLAYGHLPAVAGIVDGIKPAVVAIVLAAAWRLDRRLPANREIASAKLYASEMLARVTDEAIQIHGGLGLMADLPLERLWRDARVERIWDGTSEIQRHIISRDLLRPLGS